MNNIVDSKIPVGITFIHKNRFYYYDTNRNSLVEVSAETYKEIQQILKFGISDDCSDTISQLFEKGYFRTMEVEKIELADRDNVETYCSRNIIQLVLQVTQDCNFMCRYCLFAGTGYFERTHSNKKMTWEIAKRSIDFLYFHSIDSKEVLISFYGGEPLINFSLIKQSIEYAENLFKIKKCNFSMATNGSLLTEDKIDYLAEHEVKLAISIDGPEDIQDQNRRFYNNGKGTFTVVNKNLNIIREKYPSYFNEYVSVHPVITPSTDLNAVYAYFKETLMIPESNIVLSSINTSGLDIIFDENSLEDDSTIKDYIEKESRKFFGNYDMTYINKNKISKVFHHGGPCMPGTKKLFVNTEGQLYPCEKVNERNDINCIGNIFDGFDYEKIYKIINIGQLSESKCKKCWCMRFCTMCIADIDSASYEEAKEIKKINCEYKEKAITNYLKYRVDLAQ